MSLDQQISLPWKKASGGKKGGELRTTINLVEPVDEYAGKRTQWIVIAAIVIVVVLVGKFSIADRYIGLFKAQGEVAQLGADIADMKATLAKSSELTDEFYHYTTSMMTDEEKNIISRAEVMDLVSFMSGNGVTVSSVTVSKNVLTANIETGDLKTVSSLSSRLEEQDIVESVEASNAQYKSDEDRSGSARRVSASLTVYLKALDGEEGS